MSLLCWRSSHLKHSLHSNENEDKKKGEPIGSPSFLLGKFSTSLFLSGTYGATCPLYHCNPAPTNLRVLVYISALLTKVTIPNSSPYALKIEDTCPPVLLAFKESEAFPALQRSFVALRHLCVAYVYSTTQHGLSE